MAFRDTETGFRELEMVEGVCAMTFRDAETGSREVEVGEKVFRNGLTGKGTGLGGFELATRNDPSGPKGCSAGASSPASGGGKGKFSCFQSTALARAFKLAPEFT